MNDVFSGPRCILIMGMHRSGTSSLTGSLQERGLYLGEVFERNPHNAKGNRENARVMELNERVLACSGGAWDKPPQNITWSSGLASDRDRLIADYDTATVGVWGFKDPRSLITLPFWEAGLRHLEFVGTFRHPLSVAKSLERRGGMSARQALDLWSAYNGRLVQLWQRRPFPVVCFDAPPEKYSESLERVADAIGLPQKATAGTFFDPSLRHHAPLLSQADLSQEHLCLYEKLREISEAWPHCKA